MSNPKEILPGTGIAATSWLTGTTPHLRVYTQDVEGGIRESRWEGKWLGGMSEDVIAKAKPYSPIAAFNYNDGASIRVYYLTAENIIQEMCQDNGGEWFAGALNSSNIKTHPVSRLAVIGKTWSDHHITVYYQQPDGLITNVGQDDKGWVTGGLVSDRALIGTGLAALTFHTKAKTGIRIYYQLSSGTLAEGGIDKGGSWFNQGGLPKIETAAPATNLAVYAHGVDNPYLQLYFLGKQNTPTEYGWYGAWHGPNHPGHTTSAPSSGIAVVPVNDPSDLRLYIQDENNQIQEYVSSGAQWNKGSLIPIGHLQ